MQLANSPIPIVRKFDQKLDFLEERSVFLRIYLQFNRSFSDILFATASASYFLSLCNLCSYSLDERISRHPDFSLGPNILLH